AGRAARPDPRGDDGGALGAARGDGAPDLGVGGRDARPRHRAEHPRARGLPRADGHDDPPARGLDRAEAGRGAARARLPRRDGLRRGEGGDVPHRPHGGSHGGRAGGAAGRDRGGAGPVTPSAATAAAATAAQDQARTGADGGPGAMYRVLVADAISAEGLAPLHADGRFEVVERTGLKGEDLAAALEGCDAVIVRSSTRITADSLARAD